MPETPIIQEFSRSKDSDFSVFQWSWEGQNNLTIQTKGVRNPLGIKSGTAYQLWPSVNGAALSPENLAASIKATNVRLDHIEIILTRGGKAVTGAGSYAMQFARALGGESRVIAYSNDTNQFPVALQQALARLPENIPVDSPDLSDLAKIDDLGMPGVRPDGAVCATRIVGDKRINYQSSITRDMQPYHVRRRPEDVAGSLPKSARTEAAGRVRRDSARAAESDVEILGMFGL